MWDMKHRVAVILKIEAGNLETIGFPFSLRVLGDNRLYDGRLPAAPELRDRYDRWVQVYNNLGHAHLINIPTVQVTNVDMVDECKNAALALASAINQWLTQSTVVNSLIVPLVQALPQARGLQFFIQTSDPLLQRLPWQVWEFLSQTYPDVEVILSSDYRPSAVKLKLPVRILAIEGDTSGTTANLDLTTIELIPGTSVTLLKQPTQSQLRDHLWHESWDILLFMGHSRSQARTGEIALNPTETLSLDDLHDALEVSVENGLKLAVFNSCDGVGIASKLADLRIPYTIAMRQRIPDTIAQSFLQTFLITFSRGRSLHQAVYAARRKLQESQGRFPCAAWLPVIYQNPAAPEIRYPKPITIGRRWKYFLYGLVALVVALIFGLRSNFNPPIAPAVSPPIDTAKIYAERTSLGDRLLSQCSLTHQADLNDAPAAFAAQQYDSAEPQFQNFLKLHECPEITIYANNAAIRASQKTVIGRVAASVPIGGNNPETAEEMLRGIAQAQQESLDQGHPIEVMVVADANGKTQDNKELMSLLAQRIAADIKIKAVIGPNAADAAKTAASIYYDKLIMVTPTAFMAELDGRGQYVYRMLPFRKDLTQPLGQYTDRHPQKDMIAICVDQRSPDNGELAAAFNETRHKTDPIQPCIPALSAEAITTRLKADRAQRILIAPHIEHMADAVNTAQVAKRLGLKLLGSPTFFADAMLQPKNAKALEGMVFYSPWSPAKAKLRQRHTFAQWQHHVTWRTATSYDTFNTIATGLIQEFQQTQNTTRKGLAQFFQTCKSQACHSGTTGKVQFSSSGDRTNHLIDSELLTIKQVGQSQWKFCSVDRPQECPSVKP
jgi:branched-chain amino acid transport system substrate-binding protein